MNQDVAREVLSRVMEPGRRYTVGGLQRLFEENYDEWEDEDFSPIKGVGNVWKVAVKNSVRMSPDRPDYGDDSWSELRGEKTGRNYEYWIGEVVGAVPVVLPRSVERARPRSNDGWDAERFVKKDLEERGFKVANVSSGGFGCDLLAFKVDIAGDFWPEDSYGIEYVPQESFIRVEVKSSIGVCHPSLTEEEMRVAEAFGKDYWLAIVDNFDSAEDEGDIRINYIMDPGSLPAERRETYNYAISRESLGLDPVEGSKFRGACEDCSDPKKFEISTFERYYVRGGYSPSHAVKHVCETCGTIHTAFMTDGNWRPIEGSNHWGVYGMSLEGCSEMPVCEPYWDSIDDAGNELFMPCQFCGESRWHLRPEFLDWSH